MNHKHSCKWLQVSKIRGRSVTDMAFCSANSVLTLDTLLWNTSCAWPDLGVRSVRSVRSRRLVEEFSLPCAEEKLILNQNCSLARPKLSKTMQVFAFSC